MDHPDTPEIKRRVRNLQLLSGAITVCGIVLFGASMAAMDTSFLNTYLFYGMTLMSLLMIASGPAGYRLAKKLESKHLTLYVLGLAAVAMHVVVLGISALTVENSVVQNHARRAWNTELAESEKASWGDNVQALIHATEHDARRLAFFALLATPLLFVTLTSWFQLHDTVHDQRSEMQREMAAKAATHKAVMKRKELARNQMLLDSQKASNTSILLARQFDMDGRAAAHDAVDYRFAPTGGAGTVGGANPILP